MFSDEEIIDLRPQRNHTAVLRILHEAVRLNQALATGATGAVDVSLNDALEAATRRATHDHLVVVISDLAGANEDTQRVATELSAHNDVLIVAVYDPLGAALQTRPGMIASTAQGSMRLPSGAEFPAAFRKAFVDRLDEWREIFHVLRVPVLPISTVELPVRQLRDLFGQHLSTSR
jgi:hypothetical protein